MHNITTAVRRLSFAPKPKDMKVTDVKTGHFVFVPRADRPAHYAELRREVVNAGYDVEGTQVEVRGTLAADGTLVTTGTRQVFALSGPEVAKLHHALAIGAEAIVSGAWSGDAKGDRIEVSHWESAP
ncbi:MAG TPA: hypothetical protein VFS60_19140 [Thermoanaerobaculia bacterium]|nr:hypothetical protein [Thermoanaerobaculia bacterium]